MGIFFVTAIWISILCAWNWAVTLLKNLKEAFGQFLPFVQVDSVNKPGILLEVVQVLSDLDLFISKAYITSDGRWFMDGKLKTVLLTITEPSLSSSFED